MIEKNCDTWEDFLIYLENLKLWRKKKSCGFATEFLFRGVQDSQWEINTSLERESGVKDYLIDKYYEKVFRASTANVNCQQENWNLPPPSEYSKKLINAHGSNFLDCVFDPGNYPDIQKFFLFLRHHGFPSPLLDWTLCHWIAAFFSFPNTLNEEGKVSIFIFLESIGHCLDLAVGPKAVRIYNLGPNVPAHIRHIHQKSTYTLCVSEEPPSPVCTTVESAKKYFENHGTAFSSSPANQQYLWKCNIPKTEKKKVRKLLDARGIKESDLFQEGYIYMASKDEKLSFLKD